MPLFQPILCHKVACLGRSQIRWFESWGNGGKCELVGMPRFDALFNTTPRQKHKHDPFRLLVMTARTPAFTPDQSQVLIQSLQDIQSYFAQVSDLGVEIEIVWRLTQSLEQIIGVKSQVLDLSGQELATILQAVDAVITTPSTAMLEAMLVGLPVALLDYTNSPTYVPAAWKILAQSHLDAVIRELIDPPEAKRLYQDTILHDSLECLSPATPRLFALVDAMVHIGRDCRQQGQPLSFPQRLLGNHDLPSHLPEQRFDLAKLYPNHPTLGQMDRVLLQTELGQLRRFQAAWQQEVHDFYQFRTSRLGRWCIRLWQVWTAWRQS